MWIIEIGSKDNRYLRATGTKWTYAEIAEATQFPTREDAAEYASRYIPREIYVLLKKI